MKTALFSFADSTEITGPKSKELKIREKKNRGIECVADASPRATYVWKNSLDEVFARNGSLLLINVNDNHTGNYTCTARNGLGVVNFTILVKVTSKSPEYF